MRNLHYRGCLVAMAVLLVNVSLSGCERDGVNGLNGAQGPVGPQGITGNKGDTGAGGAVGPAGQDGTVITLVQLCGACAPAYPSVFPELAECINQKLYGVYSANGGFLVELTPGAYSSTGVGCTCVVTVGNECQVTNV